MADDPPIDSPPVCPACGAVAEWRGTYWDTPHCAACGQRGELLCADRGACYGRWFRRGDWEPWWTDLRREAGDPYAE